MHYCFRDNPEVDIYGANLFNLCLQTISEDVCNSVFQQVNSLVRDEHPDLFPNCTPNFNFHAGKNEKIKAEEIDWCSLIHGSGSTPQTLRELVKQNPKRELVCSFQPVLVTSGVYQVCLDKELLNSKLSGMKVYMLNYFSYHKKVVIIMHEMYLAIQFN